MLDTICLTFYRDTCSCTIRISCHSKFSSDGSNYVRSSMFDRSKPKIGCSSSITKRWTRSCSIDVRKTDVRVCSLSNLVKLVKAPLSSMFDHSKPKVWCSSSMTSGWTCSKNDVRVRSMFDKMVFNTSLIYTFHWN